MSRRIARNVGRPIEALESRVLFDATPLLLFDLISTKKQETYQRALPNGTLFTVKIKTGSVDIYSVDNRLQLAATGTDAHSSLTVQGDLSLANVTVAGPLNVFQATSSILAGTMTVAGSLSKLTATNITGTVAVTGNLGIVTLEDITGTLAASGSIKKLTVDSLDGALVLSGVNLGPDGMLGTGDTYSGGSIGNIVVNGPVIASTVAVGINPGPDGIYGTSDDFSAGGGLLKSITLVDGADPNSHFEAGSFGVVKSTPYLSTLHDKRLKNPLSDTHFTIPAAETPAIARRGVVSPAR